jgi:hypothetical protein
MNRARHVLLLASCFLLTCFSLSHEQPESSLARKTEHFDSDPNWHGHNNRLRTKVSPVKVRQDFGYAPANPTGRIGGLATPAAEPAYYAKPIPTLTFDDALSASGTLYVPKGPGNTVVGFFNHRTINEWRTPNTIALRVNGRGDGFHLHVEYCTGKWRAGADFIGDVDPKTGKKDQRLLKSDTLHRWKLRYEPTGNGGQGTIRLHFNDEELAMNLDPGHKLDGAAMDRFGVLNVIKSVDSPGHLYVGELEINGVKQELDAEPKWEGLNNRRTYETHNIRPVFDFGYSPTNFAGGARPGEIGGLLFRGDERYPERLAFYGAEVGNLSMKDPLAASGKVVLRRGVSDSTVLFGFFHSEKSIRHSTAQKAQLPENFLGIAIEGPSREGFYFYPVYSTDREGETGTGVYAKDPPRIHPDGKPHEWALRYDPGTEKVPGRITVTLDDKATTLQIPAGHAAIGAIMNRFGFVTAHIDGNGQEVFVDDLTYTTAAAAP